MAEQVHPQVPPPDSVEAKTKSPPDAGLTSKPAQLLPPDSARAKTTSHPDSGLKAKPGPSAPTKPGPRPGTYVVKVPKDQTYRVPPPENERLFKRYTCRKNRRSRCCCLPCWFVGLIFIFIALLAMAAGVFYLVVRPEAPRFTVDGIAIKGMNLTLPSTTATTRISPEFDIAVRASNPNDKIGIYYEEDGSVAIYYKDDDVMLSNGLLPAFNQPPNNVTVFETALKGMGVLLGSTDVNSLVEERTKGRVPLKLKLRAPVKFKVGAAVKTWKMTVKVNCDVTVDNLTEHSEIVSEDCDYGVNFWG